jgi:hypothetical protein
MSCLPKPCSCVVQTVDVDGEKPPVTNDGTMNNSVVQSVNVNAGKNRLVEWFLVAVLTVFLGTILFIGMFLVSKQTFKGYTNFVQSTIKSFDTPTVVTNTVTNTVYMTNKTISITPSNVVVFDVKWRNVKAPEGNIVQLQYSVNNQSSNLVGNIHLDVKLNNKTNSCVDYAVEGLAPMKSKNSIIFLETEPVTNLAIRVTSVKPYIP